MSDTLAEQTQSAFDFIGKLYFETSYLIKEVEGQLQQEDEAFLIGRPSGYAVTTRTSTGLDPANVEMWLPRDLTVFFVPEAATETRSGKTYTPFSKSLRVLLLHIELDGKHLDEPRVLAGCVDRVLSKRDNISKFEKLMWVFAYRSRRVFTTLPQFSYDDSYCSLEGHLLEKPLYSIRSAADVETVLVKPMVELYRRALG